MYGLQLRTFVGDLYQLRVPKNGTENGQGPAADLVYLELSCESFFICVWF